MVDGSGLMSRVELTEVNMHIEYLEFCGYHRSKFFPNLNFPPNQEPPFSKSH